MGGKDRRKGRRKGEEERKILFAGAFRVTDIIWSLMSMKVINRKGYFKNRKLKILFYTLTLCFISSNYMNN